MTTHICRIVVGRRVRNFCTFATAIIVVSFSWASYGSQLPSSDTSAGSFDAPIKKETVDLGPSPYFPYDHDIRNTLSCFYFPHLVIKEYDQGEVGAEWLSIQRNPGKLPECKLSHGPGEQVIDGWQGYFAGLKGDLVFFDGGESQFGALSFAVYDSTTGKKLFEDDATQSSRTGPSRLQVMSTNAGVLVKYLRVTEAGCDLYAEGKACWEKVKARLGLKSEQMPVCRGYPFVYTLFGTDPVESMIAYPVEVALSPHPAIRTVAGPSECWPTN